MVKLATLISLLFLFGPALSTFEWSRTLLVAPETASQETAILCSIFNSSPGTYNISQIEMKDNILNLTFAHIVRQKTMSNITYLYLLSQNLTLDETSNISLLKYSVDKSSLRTVQKIVLQDEMSQIDTNSTLSYSFQYIKERIEQEEEQEYEDKQLRI